jgi:RNA polymerase sigma-70 factor (ECF subfamily)
MWAPTSLADDRSKLFPRLVMRRHNGSIRAREQGSVEWLGFDAYQLPRIGSGMSSRDDDSGSLEDRARNGDRAALASLYALHQERLKRWVDLRLDPRMRGRVSPSDVVQEIYLAAEQRLGHFHDRPQMSFSVWVRLLAGQTLVDAHRRHFGAGARTVSREVALDGHNLSASAANLAARLSSDLTSPSQAAVRHEAHDLLAAAIEAMDPLDREVLALRHFDELTNDEVAQLLEIPKGTASKRYMRALGRLRSILEQFPGLLENLS